MRHRHLSAAHDARTHADPGRQVLRARRDGRPVRPAPGREVLARAQRAATALARHRRLFSLGELGMALKFMATRGRCAMHS